MRSPPSPYAIAEKLTGDALGGRDGKAADDFVLSALLNVRSRDNLERSGIRTLDDVMRLLRRVSALSDEPLTLERAREFPLVQAASSAYGADAFESLLPFLLPISDLKEDEGAPAPGPNTPLSRVGASHVDTGPLVVRDVSYLDPKQGLVNDCSLIAAMIALAWTVPSRLSRRLQSSGYSPPQARQFAWQFHEDESQITHVTVTGRVLVENGLLIYAKSDPPGEFWPSLTEKSYVVRQMTLLGKPPREPTRADYQLINNSIKPWRACRQLVGGQFGFKLHSTDLHREVFERLNFIDAAGKATVPLMVMSTEIEGHNDTWHKFGLHENHAYAVLGRMRQSCHVVLRNPHGKSTEVREGYFDGPLWDCGEQEPVKLNHAGVFAIEPALFNRCFDWAGWVNI